MSKKKGTTENGSMDDMDLGLCDFDGSFADGFSDEDFGNLALDDDGGSGLQSSDLARSNLAEYASGPDFELNEAESAIVRLVEGKIGGTRGRVAAAKSEKIYVTHEDFDEGPERDAFLLIFGYAENLFDSPDKAAFNQNDIKKINALRFFFCPATPGAMSFEESAACIDGQIRIDVLRLRFMLEFWLRGWKIPSLPDDADGLPARIELMAAQFEAMIGVALAREAWFEPGIEASVLLSRVIDGRDEETSSRVKHAFKDLVINYVLSISNGRVYVTGKNPILELEDRMNDPTVRVRGQLANIHWSRRF